MTPEWLNTRDPYVQYTYEAPDKLLAVIQTWGSCFDDSYAYWQPEKNPNIIKRRPVWMKQKRMPAEKHKPL